MTDLVEGDVTSSTPTRGAVAHDVTFEQHRSELTGYCSRRLGATSDAEDAVQEAFVRAWRGFDRFEGRSSLRSWLYRIATNVCLDMADGRRRRASPVDLGPASSAESTGGSPAVRRIWTGPTSDDRDLLPGGDPGDLVVARDTVRRALMTLLQHLPPRQRAVLILRDVLRWEAAEVADLLATSVASVNSALQRARRTLAHRDVLERPAPMDAEETALLARYADAFARSDVEVLTALLIEDAALGRR